MIAYQRPFSPKPEEIVHVVSLSIISLSEKPKSLRKLAVADGCCGDDVPILLSCALSTHQKLAARRNSIYGTASTFKTQIKGKDTNIFSITTLLEDRPPALHPVVDRIRLVLYPLLYFDSPINTQPW